MLASDGTLHYSDLRQLSKSASHYKHRIQETYEPTRAMRVGTCVHHLVLGQREDRPVVVFPGDARRGNAWTSFLSNTKLEMPNAEIVTAPEMADARPVAEAVLANKHVQGLMRGAELEVPLKWEMRGVPCSTGGIDILGKSCVVELKTTSCSEPDAFERHSFKMLYQAQLAWYVAGLLSGNASTPAFNVHKNAYGFDEHGRLQTEPMSYEAFIIAAEVEPPYPVTVFRLTPELLEDGAKSIALWMDRYLACRDADAWPEYAQDIVTLQAPAWARDDDSDT